METMQQQRNPDCETSMGDSYKVKWEGKRDKYINTWEKMVAKWNMVY